MILVRLLEGKSDSPPSNFTTDFGISPEAGLGEGLGDGLGEAAGSEGLGLGDGIEVGAGVDVVGCEVDAVGSDERSASARTTPGTSNTRRSAVGNCSGFAADTVAVNPEKVTWASTPSTASTETMLRADRGSAARTCLGETQVPLLRKGTTAAIRTPHNADWVMVKPDSMK